MAERAGDPPGAIFPEEGHRPPGPLSAREHDDRALRMRRIQFGHGIPEDGGRLMRPGQLSHEPSRGPRIARDKARKRRVLLVDDNRDFALSASWLLKLRGHEVELAFDGLQALEVARAFRPDVVLLDVNLPGIDGYELARRLRAEYGPAVLLIIISAYAWKSSSRQAYESYIDHYFMKPVDFTTISDLLV